MPIIVQRLPPTSSWSGRDLVQALKRATTELDEPRYEGYDIPGRQWNPDWKTLKKWKSNVRVSRQRDMEIIAAFYTELRSAAELQDQDVETQAAVVTDVANSATLAFQSMAKSEAEDAAEIHYVKFIFDTWWDPELVGLLSQTRAENRRLMTGTPMSTVSTGGPVPTSIEESDPLGSVVGDTEPVTHPTAGQSIDKIAASEGHTATRGSGTQRPHRHTEKGGKACCSSM